MAKSFVILAIIVALLAVSGCFSASGLQNATPTPVASTPTPGATVPSIDIPVPSPGTTIIWTPGSGDGAIGNYTGTLPSPSPGTSTTPTPVPIMNATTSNWGTSKDSFARGETATGWVDVTNTGNAPINVLDFTIVIKRTVFFVPVEKTYEYAKGGLDILPGETKRVEFSQSIPSDYQGVSTAGDYQLTVKAKLAGKEIGSFSKAIKVV